MQVRRVAEIVQRVALIIAVVLHVVYEGAFMSAIEFGEAPGCELVLVKEYCIGIETKVKFLNFKMQILNLIMLKMIYYTGFLVADILIIFGAIWRDDWLFVAPAFFHLYAFFNNFHMLFFMTSSIYITVFFIQITILLSMWNLSACFFDERLQDRPEDNAANGPFEVPIVRVPPPGQV